MAAAYEREKAETINYPGKERGLVLVDNDVDRTVVKALMEGAIRRMEAHADAKKMGDGYIVPLPSENDGSEDNSKQSLISLSSKKFKTGGKNVMLRYSGYAIDEQGTWSVMQSIEWIVKEGIWGWRPEMVSVVGTDNRFLLENADEGQLDKISQSIIDIRGLRSLQFDILNKLPR